MQPVVIAIDDSPDILQALGHTLGSDYDLRLATGGEDGLSLAAESAPDLILLDVMMPGINGFETLHRLKADDKLKDVPVIFLTSLNDREDEASCLAAGARDFVAKPFNSDVLKARVATQIRLKRQAEELNRLARTDCLTGLMNRRTFQEGADLAWRMCRREKQPLSLLMIDVDHFKLYNDTYGHNQGDVCLVQVANTIKAQVHRAGDLVARFGGEEFVVLLPKTSMENAQIVAERIRAGIEALAIPHKASSTAAHVTASLGISSTIPVGENNYERLLTLADRALYQAKSNGRNQVACQATYDFRPNIMEVARSNVG